MLLSVAVRSLPRVGAAAGLAVCAVMTTGQPVHAGVAVRTPSDTVFQAQTAAAAVHLVLTQQPASSIITAGLVDDAAAYAAGAFDSSGGSEAQAASVFPGNLVVQGPALFCSQVFTCPATPPDYPLLADASYPRRSHASAAADQQPVGQGPLVVRPSTSTATAAADGNSGQTGAGGVAILSGTPVAVTAGSSTASTHVTSTATALVTHVESTVSDVDIAGLVHIGAIRSTDDITVSSGKPVDRPAVTITGVTVAGVPARIDDKGVHVAGHDGPSLTQQVAQHGVDIRTVGAQRNDTSSLARSQATGLMVTFSLPVSGLPYVPNPLPSPFDQVPGVNGNGTYVGYVTLGAVGAVAGANAEPTFALGGTFPLTSPPVPASSAAGALADNPVLGAPGVAPVQAPQIGPRVSFIRGVLDGLTTDLADLYAALALGTVMLFIGWRVAVAVRRSRTLAGRGG